MDYKKSQKLSKSANEELKPEIENSSLDHGRHMPICPVCKNEDWKKVHKINLWDIEECTVCGFARIDPLPEQENRAEYFSKDKVIGRNVRKKTAIQRFSRTLKSLFKKVGRREKSGIFYKKLSKHLPPESKILDVGCGDGSFLKLAKERFVCTGIEISEYLATIAREQKDIEVMVGNFITTDFGNKKYDGITLISIIEHLDDPIKAIEKCFDLLNPGGVLLLKTVNYGCLNCKIMKGDWTGFRPPDHVIYFTPSNLKRFLKRIGFSKMKASSWPFNDNMYCDTWK